MTPSFYEIANITERLFNPHQYVFCEGDSLRFTASNNFVEVLHLDGDMVVFCRRFQGETYRRSASLFEMMLDRGEIVFEN